MPESKLRHLGPAHIDILRAQAEGRYLSDSYPMMLERHGMRPKSVDHCLDSALRVLGVTTVREAIIRAKELGVLD